MSLLLFLLQAKHPPPAPIASISAVVSFLPSTPLLLSGEKAIPKLELVPQHLAAPVEQWDHPSPGFQFLVLVGGGSVCCETGESLLAAWLPCGSSRRRGCWWLGRRGEVCIHAMCIETLHGELEQAAGVLLLEERVPLMMHGAMGWRGKWRQEAGIPQSPWGMLGTLAAQRVTFRVALVGSRPLKMGLSATSSWAAGRGRRGWMWTETSSASESHPGMLNDLEGQEEVREAEGDPQAHSQPSLPPAGAPRFARCR